MSNSDDWGRDPSIRMMRQIFGRMEKTQGQLLDSLGISSFDDRLRGWRKTARELFEQSWAKATQSGMMIDKEEAADIYINGLAKVLRLDGVDIPFEILPDNKDK